MVTMYSKQGEGVLGRVTTERNWMRLGERICSCKKRPLENIQEISSEMKTRSEQMTDKEEDP